MGSANATAAPAESQQVPELLYCADCHVNPPLQEVPEERIEWDLEHECIGFDCTQCELQHQRERERKRQSPTCASCRNVGSM